MMQVVTQTQTIRDNQTIMPEGFGGWFAQNIGTGNVLINGFIVEPNATIDFSHLDANILWKSPIVVEVQAGGVLRIMRLKYGKNDEK